MKRNRLACLALIGGLLLLPIDSWAACGPTHVCVDVIQSLSGQIETESVRVEWSTESEDSTVDYYVLKRYDCGTPESCSVTVATIDATGSCSSLEEYDYTDSPPAPVSSWTYTVEVWKTDETRACSVDTVPE